MLIQRTIGMGFDRLLCALAGATMALGWTAWVAAQPCGGRDCEISMLHVDGNSLDREADRILAARRTANDRRTTPGVRVTALRTLAEMALSLADRADRARDLGALDGHGAARFTRRVGVHPLRLDGRRIARHCTRVARQTYAWGMDARRCLDLTRDVGAPAQLYEALAYPAIPAAFFATTRPDDSARAYTEASRQAESDPTNVAARLRVAAMQSAVGNCAAARATLVGVTADTYEANLAKAEISICAGDLAGAESSLRGLIRQEQDRPAALFDLVLLLSAEPMEAPSPRARQVLAASQHLLCLTEADPSTFDRETIQDIGEAAAAALTPERDGWPRPLLPFRYLSSWNVEQERLRPLATCSGARRELGRLPRTPRPARPTAVACPDADAVARGFDALGEPLALTLDGARAVPVPSGCEGDREDTGAATDTADRADEVSADGDETFELGAMAGLSERTVAITTDAVVAGDVRGRVVRIFGGDHPRRHVADLRDEAMRFGTAVGSAGDVNGDGRTDLWVAAPSACDCCDCTGATDDLHVYLGGPDGRFSRASTVHGSDGLQNWIRAVRVGDMDGDGFDDLAIAHGSEIRLHRGFSGGTAETGSLLHRREVAMDDIDLRPIARGGFWWLDSDANEAWVVRRRRHPSPRRLAMPR